MRWRKAAVSVMAIVMALGVAAGCSETDPNEARTPDDAATVANSAPQTNSEGETVAAPGAAPAGGDAGAQTNTGAEVQGGGVTDDLSESPGGGNQPTPADGGGEESGAGGGGGPIEIPADAANLAYEKTEVTAQAGELTLRMPNPSPIPHNIAVDEPEQVIGEVVGQDGVSEITVNFPPGEYEYYCSVPGHRPAGMVGTLTVQ